ILPILYEEPVREPLPEIPAERAAAKLAGGIPLLRGERISFDTKSFRRRWLHVCAALRHDQTESGTFAQALEDGVRHGQLDPEELLGEVLGGRPGAVHVRALALGLDPGLTATVLRLTALPGLASLNAGLDPLRAATSWEYGYCPTCGSWPLLGEYRGLEQTRFLRCGFCTAAWPYARLQCPFCTTRDHQVLGYFSVEGEENRYRAATCDACRGYVKMLSTLAALDGPQLLVAVLATVHLDLAAAERGYGAPGPSADEES